MKEIYIEPQMEVIEFDNEDIIMTSTNETTFALFGLVDEYGYYNYYAFYCRKSYQYQFQQLYPLKHIHRHSW